MHTAPITPGISRFRTARFVLPIALAAGLVVAGCSRGPTAPPGGPGAAAGTGAGNTPAPIPVSTVPITISPTNRTVDVVGTLDADEDAVMSAQVAGRLTRIFADLGDRVAAGAPLAQIDPTEYQLLLAQRRAALAQTLAQLGLESLAADDTLATASFDPEQVPVVARARVEARNAASRVARAKSLVDGDRSAISEQEYTDLIAAFEVATRNAEVAVLDARALFALAQSRLAEVNQAIRSLNDTLLRAPGGPDQIDASSQPQTSSQENPQASFAVAARQVSPGEQVTPGMPLFRLVKTDPIRFRAQVPGRYASAIGPGQPVFISLDSQPEPIRGEVSRVAPAVDPTTRAFEVEVRVANPDGALKPGVFARGAIAFRNDPNARYIPAAAVVSFAGIDRAFSVKDGKAVEHRLTLGARNGDLVEVLAGLEGADAVISDSLGKLAKGLPVVVQAAAAAPAGPR